MRIIYGFAYFTFLIILFPVLCAAQEAVPLSSPMNAGPFTGGSELRVAAHGMQFFKQRIAGGSLEFAFRSAGATANRQGRFSIGVRGTYWPEVGQWNELPFHITHLSKLRVTDANGTDAGMFAGNVPVVRNDVFLTSVNGPYLSFAGAYLSWSPGASEVLEFNAYTLTNVRMSMAGIDVPIRWYWNKDLRNRPRFFSELGMGVDKLYVQADLEVFTGRIFFDQHEWTITASTETTNPDVPFDGSISRHVVFPYVNIGAGVNYGRWDLSIRLRKLLSSKLDSNSTDHHRVRGNILALPLLAGAADNAATAEEIDREGAVLYGNTSISRTGNAGGAESSQRAAGVSRYWDASHWMIGLGFRIF